MVPKICTFPECGRKVMARKLCQTHYKQKLAGKPLTPLKSAAPTKCSFKGCNVLARANNLCQSHYMQRWRGNDLTNVRRQSRPIEERFSDYVVFTESCWNWTGAIRNDGYGSFSLNGIKVMAHRFSWSHFNGNIPDGELIDHMCHNRACVNPEHLRLATYKQNAENRLGAYPTNKIGIRGVSKQGGKFYAQVRHHGKLYRRGPFENASEAGVVAQKMRDELFTHDRPEVAPNTIWDFCTAKNKL